MHALIGPSKVFPEPLSSVQFQLYVLHGAVVPAKMSPAEAKTEVVHFRQRSPDLAPTASVHRGMRSKGDQNCTALTYHQLGKTVGARVSVKIELGRQPRVWWISRKYLHRKATVLMKYRWIRAGGLVRFMR